MRYREYPPLHPALRPYIECFWTIGFTAEKAVFRTKDLLLPDGGIEWVFTLGDGFTRCPLDGKQRAKAIRGTTVVGPRSSAVTIRQTPHNRLFVIRFKPFGLSCLHKEVTPLLKDKVTAANSLFGPLIRPLRDRLTAYDTVERALPDIEELLVRYCDFRDPPMLVDRVWRAMLAQRGQVSIAALCQENGIHKSTLERLFYATTGLSPKTMAGIVRMNFLVSELYQATSLTELAYAHGYFDQSHMIRDFKKYTRLSPKAFLRKKYHLPLTLREVVRTRQEENRFCQQSACPMVESLRGATSEGSPEDPPALA